MQIFQGTSYDEPIRLKRSDVDRNVMKLNMDFYPLRADHIPPMAYITSDSLSSFLDLLFGGTDLNYFIKHHTTIIDDEGNTRVSYFVEDKDGDNHSIFFMIED